MKSLPGTPAVPEAPMVKLWVRDVALFYSTYGTIVGVADGSAIDRYHLPFMGSASREDIGIHADLVAGLPNVVGSKSDLKGSNFASGR